jgi:hypothetical protein
MGYFCHGSPAFSAFPEPVKDEMGNALGLAQFGAKHPSAKPRLAYTINGVIARRRLAQAAPPMSSGRLDLRQDRP